MFEIVDQQKVDPWGPCVCMCACVCVCVWVGGGGTTPIAPPPQLRAWTEAHHPLLGNSICIWKDRVSEDIFILLLHSHTFISYIWTMGWRISVEKPEFFQAFRNSNPDHCSTGSALWPTLLLQSFCSEWYNQEHFSSREAAFFCKLKVIRGTQRQFSDWISVRKTISELEFSKHFL